MSRWLRESLADITDINFWRTLHVGRISRMPLFHAQCWLQSGGSAFRRYKMPEFVTTKGDEFVKEFEGLLSEPIPSAWDPLLALLPLGGDRNPWLGHAALHVLQLAANWHRRLTRVIRAFPCKLLWLMCDDPGTPSPPRRRVACELMYTALEPYSAEWKIREFWEEDIRACCEDGCVSESLYEYISDLGVFWCTDVQEIEGTNNTLQHIGRLSPNISWQLLSSRIMAKETIGELPRREDRAEFVDACTLRRRV